MLDLQRAIYAALKADAQLMTLITDVYDIVPQDATLPYISFGTADWQPYEANCMALNDESLQIDVWSVYQGGYKEAKTIMAQVKAILRHTTVPINGVDVPVRINKMLAFRDADGITTHGVIDVQALF